MARGIPCPECDMGEWAHERKLWHFVLGLGRQPHGKRCGLGPGGLWWFFRWGFD